MRPPLLCISLVTLGLVAPAVAGDTVDLNSLVPVPVEVRNSGTTSILCQAEIAHWFATDLARIAPNDSASLDLRFDPQTGTWAAMNARGEALPVERAWCGLEGRTYETRWNLSLGRDQPQARQLDCRGEGPTLHCR